MESNKNKVTDVFGLAPYGDAIKIAVEKGFDGASALLSRICLPAAEEFGLWFRDKIRYWRLNHVIRILQKTESKISFEHGELQIHPRVIHEVLENGSWCEDELLQDMWAGLLATSVAEATPSDTNLLYINKLKQVTSTQTRIIEHICSNSPIGIALNGLVVGMEFKMTSEQLLHLTGMIDLHQLDAELDSLRSLELIGHGIGGGGFHSGDSSLIADVTPSAFLLQLFVKIQGYRGSIPEFYKARLIKLGPYGEALPVDEVFVALTKDQHSNSFFQEDGLNTNLERS